MPPRKTHRPPRLRGHGYDHGAYFVTLCTCARQHLFGRIAGTGPDAYLEPTDAGHLVLDELLALPGHFKHLRSDQVQLMPDHLHAILILDRRLLGDGPDGALGSGSTLKVDAAGAEPDRPAGSGASAGHTTATIARTRGPRPGSVGAILAAFKASTTYKLNKHHNTPGRRYWQLGYHDRVIRTTGGEFERIARYIAENPAKWR
jgi:REP element-mobilizing transposase RayT